MSTRRYDFFALGSRLPGIFGTAVLIFLMAPLLVVIPVSFSRSSLLQFPPKQFSWRWYLELIHDPSWLAATQTSLKVGIIVAVISVILGTLTALAITRGRFRGRALLQAFILSPLIAPVIIVAVSLYYFFSFLKLNGTITGLVIGHTVLTFPYATVVITASLERFDVSLEQAAMSLGATRIRAFFRVTLPMIRPGVIVAALFAFLISFDEVVIAIFVTGPETITLPRKMWDGIRFELNPTIAAVSTILIVFSCLFMLVSEGLRRWLTRNLGAGRGRKP